MFTLRLQLIDSAIVASILGATPVRAATLWDEVVNGDLSSNNLSPTPLTWGIGMNSVRGTMGRDLGAGVPLDPDFFTFSLSPGQALISIVVSQFDPQGASFYALAAGTSIDTGSPANHLSNILVTGTGEVLAALDAGSYNGGLGLTAPLGAGTYTVWFQELSSVVTYQMDYTVVAIPESGGAGVGLALGAPATLMALTRRAVVRS